MIVVILNFLWWNIFPISSLAEPLVGADLILPRDNAAVLPPVAGIPYDEASRIVARHQEELMRLPGMQGISLGPEGILIHTEVPTALPATIEGLPVKALPPLSASQPPSLDQAPEENSAPETQQGSPLPPPGSSEPTLPPIAGIPYEEAVAIANRHREELMRLPGIYFVGVGDGGLILGVTIPSKDRTIDPEELSRVTTNLPSVIEGLPVNVKPLPILSPPSGVIILRPQGVREQADSCPQEFTEVKILSWRFCVNPSNPESIPPLMEPPIAGIPYEKAVAILERH